MVKDSKNTFRLSVSWHNMYKAIIPHSTYRWRSKLSEMRCVIIAASMRSLVGLI